MKKFFTLISVALFAMSANAQTDEPEIWHASSINLETANANGTPNTSAGLQKVTTIYGTDPIDPSTPETKAATTAAVIADADASNTLTDYTITANTTNITLKAVTTPNSDKTAGDWKFAGNNNVILNSTNLGDECLVEFDEQYLVAGTGNPTMTSVEYFFLNSNNEPVGPRYAEIPWTNGCGELPAKGCYYEFTAKTAGTLIVGFFLNKDLAANPLYLIDESTKALVPRDNITISAFRQNCNFEVEQGSTTKLVDYALDDNYYAIVTYGGGTNRQLYGYLSWDVAANGKYIMMSPQSQMGIYGFYFAPNTTGITDITKNVEENVNAPVYNLAGQKVNANAKGLLIKNGKKFIVK